MTGWLRRMRKAAWLESMLAGIGRARTLGLAAEMSFWLFLALVPLAAVAGFVAARLATSHFQLLGPALGAMPAPVREMLVRQVTRVAEWRGGTLAPVAAATYLWLASSGVHAIFDALEVQTGTTRPWWKKRLLAVATCIAFSVGGALLGVLAAGLDWVAALAGRALPDWLVALAHGPLARAARWTAGALLAVALMAGLYRVAVPRPRDARLPVVPGAVLAVALQALLGWGYGFYVTKLGGGGSAYLAGLAVVGITLMTLWLFSIALLLGAQLNLVLAERRLAGDLRAHQAWRSSGASSSQPISPRPPTAPSTGPSSSQHGSGQPSP